MTSPLKFSYQSFIQIDKESTLPVYMQITQGLIYAIQKGICVADQKLPGTRVLSKDLSVHRNTITKAYAELQDQGWVEIKQKRGVFVLGVNQRKGVKYTQKFAKDQGFAHHAGFSFKKSNLLSNPFEYTNSALVFNHGIPDVSLTQIQELVQLYSANIKRKSNQNKLGYSQEKGSNYFKKQLCNYLNFSRALHINKQNLMVSRSLEMSLYVLCQVILEPLDKVVVGELSYFAANMIFQNTGAKILQIKVDRYGLCTKDLRVLCQNHSIRAVYVSPQAHYPTTSSMSRKRQTELLELAQQYNFIIIEDATDYDFTYSSTKDVALVKQDKNARVVYIGSFGRSLVPGFRASFIVGALDIILELDKYSNLIDRQGDILMELALGEMIEEGTAVRHLNRSLQVYIKRRDNLAYLLDKCLKDYFTFTIPNTGLAIWIVAKKPINLLKMSYIAQKKGLFIPKNILYQNKDTTAMRIGFGNLELDHMKQSIEIIAQILKENPSLFSTKNQLISNNSSKC